MTLASPKLYDDGYKIRARGSQMRFLQRWQGLIKTTGAIAQPKSRPHRL